MGLRRGEVQTQNPSLTQNSITPWFTNMGYQNCFISAAFIGLFISSLFLIFIKWGKAMRQRSAITYWNLVRFGHVH